jgi:hypothetical protein
MSDIPCREPLIFAAGDTLNFKRFLRDYLPSAGWSLSYQVRGGARGDDEVAFDSTADVDEHEVTVDAATTSLWLPGDYVLVGYAVNGEERHQVYYGELTVTANLGTDANDAVVTTHAQRMIALIERQLEELAAHSLQDSNIQQTEIRRVQRMDLERQLALNKEIRANEIAHENVQQGRPSGLKITPMFRILG